ncbi:hypothetical protein evm_014668 [Chilo suppressalis]|nr:hypothetical protein evm_014668 [Chilo suppressalis]
MCVDGVGLERERRAAGRRWQGCPQIPERDAAGNDPGVEAANRGQESSGEGQEGSGERTSGEAERREPLRARVSKRQLLQRREEARTRRGKSTVEGFLETIANRRGRRRKGIWRVNSTSNPGARRERIHGGSREESRVPAWKRQLLQRRTETENRLRQSLYTPKVEETNCSNGTTNGEWRAYPSGTQRAVSIDNISLCYDTPSHPVRAPSEAKLTSDHCNGHSITNGKHEDDAEDESAKIIPWRAQLRKTNSKLNLLE